ncbi:hypothetical protein GCM10020221_18700 [Streptomyces thioluteus]|uniref:Cytochrome bc1 complex cytochrome b subunit n=1 Tax=Streptomyces thioluteus TaxID=66431 RepID=A0ABP6J635_STRTU
MSTAETTSTRADAQGRKAPAGERVADWADGRLGIYTLAKGGMRKIFPDHWSFMLGEVCLYSFIIIILTGVYLTLFFHPSMNEVVYHGSYVPMQGVRMSEAFKSTLDISFDVRGGLLIRQIHHWAALVFIAGMMVHMMRVFFTGAFRKPREINWLFGFLLLVLGTFTGFTGYSLPDDLLSGTGVRIADGLVMSIPLVGTYISFYLFGGEFPGTDFVSRFYSIHILLLPGIMLGLVVGHLILVFYHKHTQFAGPGRTNKNVVGMPLMPVYMAKAGGFFFLVFGVIAAISAIASINPVWELGPYRPDQVSTNAQPDWYLGMSEGLFRIMPGWEISFAGHTLVLGVFIPLLGLRRGAGDHGRLPVPRVVADRRQARAPHPGPPAQRPDAHRLRRGVADDVRRGPDGRWKRPVGHPLPPVGQRGHLVRPHHLLRRPGPGVHRHAPDLHGSPAPRQGQGAARPRVGHHQAPAAR